MKRLGFTIFETLLTLLLLQVVLAVLGGLLWEYSRISQDSEQSDLALGAQSTLLQICAEVRESIQIDPAPPELKLVRLDPAKNSLSVKAGDRLPYPAPDPDPLASWNVQQAIDLINVRYYIDQDQLMRQVSDATTTVQIPVSQGITGLSASWLANGNLQVDLSVRIETQIFTFRSEVFRGLP